MIIRFHFQTIFLRCCCYFGGAAAYKGGAGAVTELGNILLDCIYLPSKHPTTSNHGPGILIAACTLSRQ